MANNCNSSLPLEPDALGIDRGSPSLKHETNLLCQAIRASILFLNCFITCDGRETLINTVSLHFKRGFNQMAMARLQHDKRWKSLDLDATFSTKLHLRVHVYYQLAD